MARRSSKTDSDDNETGRSPGSAPGRPVLRAVTTHPIHGWVAKVQAAKVPLDEAKMQHAQAWKDFADHPDYHKKAFKHCMVVRAMEPAARAEYFRKREEYENELGLHDQLPLPLDQQEPAA